MRLSPELVQRLSPENLSVMEFKSDIDIRIVEKMAHFPPLGEDLGFHREFHVADDAHLMINVSQFDKKGALIEYGKIKEKAESFAIVYEGKNIWQYTSAFAEPTKACIIKDTAIGYKLCYRVISATTNERTFIAALIPSVNKTVNSLNVSRPSFESAPYLFNTTVFNSFLSDFFIRMITNNNIHVSTLSSLPLPRFQSELDHPYFRPLVERAARLVGTTAAYDELVHEVFGKDAGHKTHGEPDPTRRQKLKNEIDAMVARIYDLTEEELRHVLSTFPLVEEAIKEAVMEEWGRLG